MWDTNPCPAQFLCGLPPLEGPSLKGKSWGPQASALLVWPCGRAVWISTIPVLPGSPCSSYATPETLASKVVGFPCKWLVNALHRYNPPAVRQTDCLYLAQNAVISPLAFEKVTSVKQLVFTGAQPWVACVKTVSG